MARLFLAVMLLLAVSPLGVYAQGRSYSQGFGYAPGFSVYGPGLGTSYGPGYGSGFGYDPYESGRFKAPDLHDDPLFRAQHKFDSHFPGRYSQQPSRLQMTTPQPARTVRPRSRGPLGFLRLR